MNKKNEITLIRTAHIRACSFFLVHPEPETQIIQNACMQTPCEYDVISYVVVFFSVSRFKSIYDAVNFLLHFFSSRGYATVNNNKRCQFRPNQFQVCKKTDVMENARQQQRPKSYELNIVC